MSNEKRAKAEQLWAAPLPETARVSEGRDMVLAEFLALMAAATPVPPPAAKPLATTYNAIVAIEETPAANDLVRPAVFVGDGSKDAIIGSASPGPIA